jgi:hypothetical protein
MRRRAEGRGRSASERRLVEAEAVADQRRGARDRLELEPIAARASVSAARQRQLELDDFSSGLVGEQR